MAAQLCEGVFVYSLLCIRKVSSVWEKYLVHS